MKEPFISVDGLPEFGYIDADVYFVMDDKSEWKLRYTYSYEDGQYLPSDPMFSAGPDGGFDDAEDPTPPEVQAKFDELIPELRRRIDERIAYLARPLQDFKFTTIFSCVIESRGRTREEAKAHAEAKAKLFAGRSPLPWSKSLRFEVVAEVVA